jgi:hypothetical protein
MLFRRIVSFLLLLVFFVQAFSRYFLIADYYIHTATYAENCVNKERPSMHCNGRCQLCKKLHQQEKADDKQTPDNKSGSDRNETPFSAASSIDFTALQGITLSKIKFPEMPSGSPVRMPRYLFHPPGYSAV